MSYDNTVPASAHQALGGYHEDARYRRHDDEEANPCARCMITCAERVREGVEEASDSRNRAALCAGVVVLLVGAFFLRGFLAVIVRELFLAFKPLVRFAATGEKVAVKPIFLPFTLMCCCCGLGYGCYRNWRLACILATIVIVSLSYGLACATIWYDPLNTRADDSDW
mmetsp:Transcript_20406/g.56673  ORF Transcript_20406/g.56673 Transcript_20406/m.56673 type:complete len:168 (+) Transcript_20406:78-581(+)